MHWTRPCIHLRPAYIATSMGPKARDCDSSMHGANQKRTARRRRCMAYQSTVDCSSVTACWNRNSVIKAPDPMPSSGGKWIGMSSTKALLHGPADFAGCVQKAPPRQAVLAPFHSGGPRQPALPRCRCCCRAAYAPGCNCLLVCRALPMRGPPQLLQPGKRRGSDAEAQPAAPRVRGPESPALGRSQHARPIACMMTCHGTAHLLDRFCNYPPSKHSSFRATQHWYQICVSTHACKVLAYTAAH